MKCKSCNKKLSNDVKFCRHCGTAVKAASKQAISADDTEQKKASVMTGTMKIVVITGVILVALLLITILASSNIFGTGDGIRDDRLMFAVDDDRTLYLLDDDEATEITDDLDGMFDGYDFIVNGPNEFFMLSDIAESEATYDELGSLTMFNAKGDDEDINEDVVKYSVQLIEGLLWYQKADEQEMAIWVVDNGRTEELIDGVEMFSNFTGTGNSKLAYYITLDNEKDENTVYLLKNGEEQEIYSAEGVSLYLNNLLGNVYMIGILDEVVGNQLYYIDGEEVVKLADDLVTYAHATENGLFYANVEGELVFVDLNAQSETFDEYDFTYLQEDTLYYRADDDLYAVDTTVKTKRMNEKKVAKGLDEGVPYQLDLDIDKIYMADEDELVVLDLLSGKSKTLEADNDITHIFFLGDSDKEYCMFLDEKDEMYLYDGRKIVLIEDDAEDIDYARGVFNDSKLMWLDGDKLMMADFNGENKDRVKKNIIDYIVFNGDVVYLLNEDGDILAMDSKGRTTEVLSDVVDYFVKVYE